MREVQLTRNRVTIIDDADWEVVSKLTWNVSVNRAGQFYAATHIDGKRIRLHRFLAGATAGQIVDHINGDTLDNRRENLRLCTATQNCQNAKGRRSRNTGIPFKGVHPDGRRFYAAIKVNKKYMYLGAFGTMEEAARAYDTAAKQFFGPFARLNFPNEHQHQSPSPSSLAKEHVKCLPACGKVFP